MSARVLIQRRRQVARGTSLENIHFYATDSSVNPATTQQVSSLERNSWLQSIPVHHADFMFWLGQGIYMENGSGGFLSDLYFVGGLYG